ncbi:MAG: DUF5131 family protein [Saprospiraceae bacterium]|nr:DUF5131 family protein [Saprospiraceae bacterium]
MINTKIPWAEHTWNPWMGCVKMSAGCDYCYMHRILAKNGSNGSIVRRTNPKTFNSPIQILRGSLIFTCSMSDFFIDAADPWRDDAWKIIKNTPHHTYLILTKRVGRIKNHLPSDWGNGYPNVILGTSIEDQAVINRMVVLSNLKTPVSSFKLFISAEPLIGQIDFIQNPTLEAAFVKIDWIIAGGESGDAPVGTPNVPFCYRPCDLKWIDKIIGDCKLHNMPFFLKQVGNHLARVHKLKDKQGGNINEWDPNYQIRQFP